MSLVTITIVLEKDPNPCLTGHASLTQLNTHSLKSGDTTASSWALHSRMAWPPPLPATTHHVDHGLQRTRTEDLPSFWVLSLSLLGPGPQAERVVRGAGSQYPVPDRKWPGSQLSFRCCTEWRTVVSGSLEVV